MGLICVLISLSIFGLWIKAFGLGENQADRVAIFHSYLPEILHGRYNTSFLVIAFSVSAIILCSISLKITEKPWKVLNTITLIISILLLLLSLFSLM